MISSTSRNHFIDTCVLLRRANGGDRHLVGDTKQIIAEAVEGSRNIWVSSTLFAELRPSSFIPGEFSSISDLAMYVRTFATIIEPSPDMGLMAARLRDLRWARHDRMSNEKPRCMSLGDALHLTSAFWVKKYYKVDDLDFLTFDDGKGSSSTELDPGTKPLSILRLEHFTDGISRNEDVKSIVSLDRRVPFLRRERMI